MEEKVTDMFLRKNDSEKSIKEFSVTIDRTVYIRNARAKLHCLRQSLQVLEKGRSTDHWHNNSVNKKCL